MRAFRVHVLRCMRAVRAHEIHIFRLSVPISSAFAFSKVVLCGMVFRSWIQYLQLDSQARVMSLTLRPVRKHRHTLGSASTARFLSTLLSCRQVESAVASSVMLSALCTRFGNYSSVNLRLQTFQLQGPRSS